MLPPNILTNFCALSLQNNSVSPSDSLRASEKHRASSDYSLDSKKRKMEEKDNLRYVSVHTDKTFKPRPPFVVPQKPIKKKSGCGPPASSF